jgi:hypothetical protein
MLDTVDFPIAFRGALRAGWSRCRPLFFAYGLGNSMTFPMAVAAAVLCPERPTPDAVRQKRCHRPVMFAGVPTLNALLLAHSEIGKGT